MSLEVTLLGTGGPPPDPRRAGQSILVEAGPDRLLFDVGPGATVRAVEAGVRLTDIGFVFLSHHHFDHVLDFAHLVLARWDMSGGLADDLRVYGPTPTERMVAQLFDEGGLLEADLRTRTRDPVSRALFIERGGTLPRERPHLISQDVSGGIVASRGDWMVTAAPTFHSDHVRTLAYRVDFEDEAVVIAGDCVPCRSVVTLARSADVLVHMCVTHPSEATSRSAATPAGVGRVARDAGVRRVVLVHLGSVVDDPAAAAAIVEEVRQEFGGEVVVGRDLLKLSASPDLEDVS